MEKDNKVLLGAVLILLVAMLSFNFNSVTGNVTNKEDHATVSVNTNTVYFSQEDLNNRPTKPVMVTVRVDSGQVENQITLYRATGEKTNKREKVCESKTNCESGKTYTVEFGIGTDLEEGDYYFTVEGHKEQLNGNTFTRDKFNSNTITLTKFSISNPNN